MSINAYVNPQQGGLAAVKANNVIRASTVQLGGTSIASLTDVALTAPVSDASILIYDSAASRWKNRLLSDGITVSNTGAVTVNYPQSIATAASPIFAGLTINGPASINGNLNVNNGFNVLPSATSGSITLGSRSFYINSGGAVTWTLPTVASSLGALYFIKNRGTGAITLNPSGSDYIYLTSIVSSLTINVGEAYIVACDGSFWQVM